MACTYSRSLRFFPQLLNLSRGLRFFPQLILLLAACASSRNLCFFSRLPFLPATCASSCGLRFFSRFALHSAIVAPSRSLLFFPYIAHFLAACILYWLGNLHKTKITNKGRRYSHITKHLSASLITSLTSSQYILLLQS